jgi:hypothetical protein
MLGRPLAAGEASAEAHGILQRALGGAQEGRLEAARLRDGESVASSAPRAVPLGGGWGVVRFRTRMGLRTVFLGRIAASGTIWGRFAAPAQRLLRYAPLTPVHSVEQCSTHRPPEAACGPGRAAVPTE